MEDRVVSNHGGTIYMPPESGERGYESLEAVIGRLQRSAFRARFSLKQEDRDVIEQKGWETIRAHATDLLRKRIAPAEPLNDGRQTPWKGHPVFVAQHATAICCRKCLANWHGIPRGQALIEQEIEYLVNLLVYWLRLDYDTGGKNLA